MISRGFVRLKVPIAIVVAFALATSPLLFLRPIGAFPVEEGATSKRTEYLRNRQRKYDEYTTSHSLNRRAIELIAPYWKIGGGFESTLVLNNTFPRDIEVTPIVYADDGRRIAANTITVGKMASTSVPLSGLIGVEGQGQLSLRFHGEPLEVHGSVVIANEAQSLSFNHPLQQRRDFSSSQIDGIFYKPSASSGIEVALSNVSGQMLNVTLLVRGENPTGAEGRTAGPSQPIALGPHETKVVSLRPYLSTTLSGPSAGGLVITHSGTPGDLLVHGMLSDRDGFSANMRFLEREMLTSLDLTSPIYQRGEAKPIVLLSNTGTEGSTVDLRARYTLNGEKQERVLWSATVGPRNATHVDLSQPMRSLPGDAAQIALKMTDTNRKGGILADVLLIDNSGSGVLQMFPKGYSGEVHPSHGFPFRIDGRLNTIITVANPSDTEEIQYSLHLYYDGGTYTYDDTLLLPGETKHIDVRELRDRSIPGQRKAILPRTVTSGQGKVHFRPKKGSGQRLETLESQPPVSRSAGGHHGGARLGGVAGATTFDTTGKMSFGTICQVICIMEVWDVNGYIEGEVGETYAIEYQINLLDGGYVYVWNLTFQFEPYNTSIAEVYESAPNEYAINLNGVGEEELYYTADFEIGYYGCGDCGYGWSCYEGLPVLLTVHGVIYVTVVEQGGGGGGGGGPTCRFLKNDNSPIDGNTEALNVSNYVTTEELPTNGATAFSTTSSDPDNFRLELEDSTVGGASVEVTLKINSQPEVLYVLDKKDGSRFRGLFLRLVTDELDDAASGEGASSDMYKQTIRVELGDLVFMKYNPVPGVLCGLTLQVGRPNGQGDNTANQLQHDIREIHLHIVVFKNNAGSPSVTRANVMTDIANANERLAQSTIRINMETLDINMGGPGDPGVDRPPALQDGFTAGTQRLNPATDDELAVLPYKDNDNPRPTIDIFYVQTLNGAGGVAYPAIWNQSGNAQYKNWIVIPSTSAGGLLPTAPAHEIMHILVNETHDRGTDPPTAVFSPIAAPDKRVDGTKRIGPYPGAAAAGLGNNDTATMRGNVATLP